MKLLLDQERSLRSKKIFEIEMIKFCFNVPPPSYHPMKIVFAKRKENLHEFWNTFVIVIVTIECNNNSGVFLVKAWCHISVSLVTRECSEAAGRGPGSCQEAPMGHVTSLTGS